MVWIQRTQCTRLFGIYYAWLTQSFHLDQHELSYDETLRMKDRILTRAREHHNPRRPWELYFGKEDGEYLT